MRIISNSIYHISTTLLNLKDIKIDFFVDGNLTSTFKKLV